MTKEQLEALRAFLRRAKNDAKGNSWGLDAASYYTGRCDAFTDVEDQLKRITEAVGKISESIQ